VLLFTVRREVRGAYQTLFARGEVTKTYLARSSVQPGLAGPQLVSNRIVKRRGILQAAVEPGEPNARTLVEPLGQGRYRLTPATGRTHQLRVHMAGLGLPIDNDPLYPSVDEPDPTDFSRPLRLLANQLEFTDPMTRRLMRFASSRSFQDC
jgi:tRNA pseudouridine32 synthase/23S rRNA pseudouridine746 synthase